MRLVCLNYVSRENSTEIIQHVGFCVFLLIFCFNIMAVVFGCVVALVVVVSCDVELGEMGSKSTLLLNLSLLLSSVGLLPVIHSRHCGNKI